MFLACCSVLLPTLAWAQNMNATISGTVSDPSGTVVPNADITLTAKGELAAYLASAAGGAP